MSLCIRKFIPDSKVYGGDFDEILRDQCLDKDWIHNVLFSSCFLSQSYEIVLFTLEELGRCSNSLTCCDDILESVYLPPHVLGLR